MTDKQQRLIILENQLKRLDKIPKADKDLAWIIRYILLCYRTLWDYGIRTSTPEPKYPVGIWDHSSGIVGDGRHREVIILRPGEWEFIPGQSGSQKQ